MAGPRSSRVERTTKETQIAVELGLDGSGARTLDTPVPFLGHMLDALARHGVFDLTVHARGDIEIDAHHTVEDIGLVLGTRSSRRSATAPGSSATATPPCRWTRPW